MVSIEVLDAAPACGSGLPRDMEVEDSRVVEVEDHAPPPPLISMSTGKAAAATTGALPGLGLLLGGLRLEFMLLPPSPLGNPVVGDTGDCDSRL